MLWFPSRGRSICRHLKLFGRIVEVGFARLFNILPLRLLRRSANVESTGAFDLGEVVLEAGDDRRDVVDGDYRLLLEECVAYVRGWVTVMRRPYVMLDRAVLGKRDNCSCMWRGEGQVVC